MPLGLFTDMNFSRVLAKDNFKSKLLVVAKPRHVYILYIIYVIYLAKCNWKKKLLTKF